MAKPRDSQRSKVLTAISSVPEERLVYTDHVTFVRKIFDSVTGRAGVRIKGYVYTRIGSPCRSVRTSPTVVTIYSQRDIMSVLHGWAHVLAPVEEHHPAHGPEFCVALLELTKGWAPSLYAPLQQQFKEHRVKTRRVDPETFAAKQAQREQKKQEALEKKVAALEESLASLVKRNRR